MADPSDPTPTGAELVDEHLLAVKWTNGKTLHYPLDHLRAHCPCAHCVHGDAPVEADPSQHAGVTLRSLEELGSYAFQIGFSDGHNLGIYTYEHLRRIGFPEGQAPVPHERPSFEV